MKNETQAPTLYSLIEDLIDSLDIDRDEILSSSYPEDLLHEYAESQVPVYHRESLYIAISDLSLIHPNDEFMTNDENTTSTDIINANIYLEMYRAASEWLEQQKLDIHDKFDEIFPPDEPVKLPVISKEDLKDLNGF